MHRGLLAGIGSIPETGRGQGLQSPLGGGGPDPAEPFRPWGGWGGLWSVSLELWEAIAGFTARAGMVGWRAIGGTKLGDQEGVVSVIQAMRGFGLQVAGIEAGVCRTEMHGKQNGQT